MVMKVVINRCHGGFGLSEKAYTRLIELGMRVTQFDDEGHYKDGTAGIFEWTKPNDIGLMGRYGLTDRSDPKIRTDQRLITIVEELGGEADGRFADLKVVEIPDGIKWEIDEYDGIEHIDEVHRTWP